MTVRLEFEIVELIHDERQQVNRSMTPRTALIGLIALAILATSNGVANAQKSWEYSPYDLRVWVALEPSPRLSDANFDVIAKNLKRRGKIVGKAAWKVRPSLAPQTIASDILYYMDEVTPEQLIEADSAGKDDVISVADKVYLAAVTDERFRFRVVVRELDMHTRIWGRQFSANVVSPDRIADTVTNLMVRAFNPVIRIEEIIEKKKAVVARLRSSGLLVGDSICSIADGDVFQPVVRRNDRLGQPLRGGIVVPPWTVCHMLGFMTEKQFEELTKEEEEPEEGEEEKAEETPEEPTEEEEEAANQLTLNIKLWLHGGRSNPLGLRKGLRTQRYGVLIRPNGESTRILLKSDVIGAAHPLVGYDFYEKDPHDKKIPAKHLGKSDWRGAFDVKPNGSPFRLIYVRSGGKLMARMPTVPGQHPSVVAFMRDDDRRLQAESYVRSVESEIMDQVVQRKLLARDFQKRLDAGRTDDAKTVLERFQALPKQTNMKDRLDSRKGEIIEVGVVDPRTERLIKRLFGQTEKLVAEHIDPATLLKLQRALEEKKGN